MNSTSPLHLGDEVEIIGPPKYYTGPTKIGEKFKISWMRKTDDGMLYAADNHPWHPASSLRKVEELQIGDWVEIVCPGHWQDGEKFQIACISDGGYKDKSLKFFWDGHYLQKVDDPELRMGDYAEVILPDTPFTGQIGRVSDVGEKIVALYNMGVWHDLWSKFEAMCKDMGKIEKRLALVEAFQKEQIENHADLCDKIEEVDERLLRNLPRIAELEGLQKEDGGLDTENNLQKGDWIQIMNSPICHSKSIGCIYRIVYLKEGSDIAKLSDGCYHCTYHLRKLSDEEICQKLNERESAMLEYLCDDPNDNRDPEIDIAKKVLRRYLAVIEGDKQCIHTRPAQMCARGYPCTGLMSDSVDQRGMDCYE